MLKSLNALPHFEVACEESVDAWTKATNPRGCKEMLKYPDEGERMKGREQAQAPRTPEKAKRPMERRWSVGLTAVPVTPELVEQKREPLDLMALDDECSPCPAALPLPLGAGGDARASLGSFLASIGGAPATPREQSAEDQGFTFASCQAPAKQPPSIKKKHRLSKAAGGSRVSLLAAMARKGKKRARSCASEAAPRAGRSLLQELNAADQSHKEKVVTAFLTQIETSAVL